MYVTLWTFAVWFQNEKKINVSFVSLLFYEIAHAYNKIIGEGLQKFSVHSFREVFTQIGSCCKIPVVTQNLKMGSKHCLYVVYQLCSSNFISVNFNKRFMDLNGHLTIRDSTLISC